MRSGPKSHLGCRLCKKRKVKCDEQTPACGACIRREEHCSFLEVTLYKSHSRSSTSSNGLPTEQPPPPKPSWWSPVLDIDLTHYYLTQTFPTIMFDTRRRDCWSNTIFPLSFDSLVPGDPDFGALHGHLATAALHKIATLPLEPASRVSLIACAAERQSNAISSLIRMLDAPNPDNAPALFALSVLVTIWAFASRCLPTELNSISRLAHRDAPESDASEPNASTHHNRWHLSHLVTIIHVSQGMRAVTEGCAEWLRARHPAFALMLRVPEQRFDATPASLAAVADLEKHIAATHRAGDGEMYSTELRRVEYMQALRLDDEARELLLGWLAGLAVPYLRALAEGEQAALAVLAFWAACFHAMDGTWWGQGWGVRIVEEVYDALSEEWRSFLDWPLEVVGRLDLRGGTKKRAHG